MSTTTHDIYDPPPAPTPWVPPAAEPLAYTRGDLLILGGLCATVLAVGLWASSIETTLGLWITVGGIFVILESWFSALTFLHRHPEEHAGRRWTIFLAALVPWGLGLGFATALMLALFLISDLSS